MAYVRRNFQANLMQPPATVTVESRLLTLEGLLLVKGKHACVAFVSISTSSAFISVAMDGHFTYSQWPTSLR